MIIRAVPTAVANTPVDERPGCRNAFRSASRQLSGTRRAAATARSNLAGSRAHGFGRLQANHRTRAPPAAGHGEAAGHGHAGGGRDR